MPKETEPVLIVLPDASIRMMDVATSSGGDLSAAHVLREYPGHSLGRVPDPRRSKLSPDTPLKPGSTYYLTRPLPPPSSSSMNSIPVLVLPQTPSAASTPGSRGFSFFPPPSPTNTNPISWRSSSIGSESSCSDMVSQTMDSLPGEEDNLGTVPPPLLAPLRTASATTPSRQGSERSAPRSPFGRMFSPNDRRCAGMQQQQQHQLGMASSSNRVLKGSLSEKERRPNSRVWSPSSSQHDYNQGQSPAALQYPLRLDSLTSNDDSCQIMSPTSASCGHGPLSAAAENRLYAQLASPRLPVAGSRLMNPQLLAAVPSVQREPRSTPHQPIRRTESCTVVESSHKNPILMELREIGEDGAREEDSPLKTRTPRNTRHLQHESKSRVAAKLGAALGKIGLGGLVKGKALHEKAGKRGSSRRGIDRAATELREVEGGEIEYNDSSDLHQEWNSPSSRDELFFSTPFKKDLQVDSSYKKRQLQEW